MNVAPFFSQKATLEQQLDNPGARGFRPQPIGRTQDLFQIFILHEAGIPVIAESNVASVK
ncbi:Uncharacterised protein [Salmonella enterica subsp. arizonae]|uniref:Uncharacterized protein n=1 Tax=Salmonella enterica subsp. arizonae TaxID=59203 RepID=A0A3S4G847_SALER|nr:Uncharacterised protein [Salmonella enterica subsp. arizonae]